MFSVSNPPIPSPHLGRDVLDALNVSRISVRSHSIDLDEAVLHANSRAEETETVDHYGEGDSGLGLGAAN